MNIRLANFLEEQTKSKIVKCNNLNNDMIFIKYDIKLEDIIEINGNQCAVLIEKGIVYDVQDKEGKYIVINEEMVSNENIKEEWKDLHIRKTENDELCVIFLNNNIISHNRYFINNPIKYMDFTNKNSEIFIKIEGYYDFKIENPKEFFSKVIGLRSHFSKQELIEKVRKYILKSIEEGINEISQEYKLNIDDLPENSKKLEIKLKQNEYDKKLLEYGVKLTYFDISKLEIVNKKFKIF